MASIDDGLRAMRQSEEACNQRRNLLEAAAETGRTKLANFFDEIVQRFTDERIPMEELAFEKASFAVVRNQPRFTKTTVSTIPVWSIGSLNISQTGELWLPGRSKIKYLGHRDFPSDGLFFSRRPKLQRAAMTMSEHLRHLDITFTIPKKVDFNQLYDEWLKSALANERGIGRSKVSGGTGDHTEYVDIASHDFFNFRYDTGLLGFSVPIGKGTELIDSIEIQGSAWRHPDGPGVPDHPVASFGLVREYLDYTASDMEPVDEVLSKSCATIIMNHRRSNP